MPAAQEEGHSDRGGTMWSELRRKQPMHEVGRPALPVVAVR